MILQEVYDEFILSRILQNLSSRSVEAYKNFLMPFLVSIGLNKPFSCIGQADIRQSLLGVVSRPLSDATKATYIRHFKVFLKWASDEYPPVAFKYQSIKVPKSPKKEVPIYTASEIHAIFDAVDAESDWLVYRNKAILALMYDSGLRRSEVCTLERSFLSFEENRLTVHGKGNKDRTVPLGNLTRQYLTEYFKTCPFSSRFVFVSRRGDYLTGNTVKLLVRKISEKLPFEFSSHKLRHNFATNYCIDQYEKTGQVDIYKLMYLMGHSDVETTSRYLHFAYEILASRDSISHLDKLHNALV